MKWLLKYKHKYNSKNYSDIYNQQRTNSKPNLTMEKSRSRFTNYPIKYILLLTIFSIQIQAYMPSNEITIKISVTEDEVQILGSKFDQAPSSVTSNDVDMAYYDENFQSILLLEEFVGNCLFTLTWSEPLDSLQGIFTNLTDLLEVDLSNFDASLVTTMVDMFYGCTSLTSVKFGNINTASLEKMNSMFSGCYSLLELDLSSFDTSKVTNMSFTFYNCSGLKSLNVANFNTSSVLDMNTLFYQLKSLEKLEINFNTSKVVDMAYMFYQCETLTSLNLATFDTSSVTNMEAMFYECISLKSLDLSNFNTSNVTNMEFLFTGCASLTYLDISNFNTSNVINIDYLFCSCKLLKTLILSNLDTSNAIDMESMFYECESLTSLDLSNFRTEKVRSMKYMFERCKNLTYLDLSSFDTSSIVNFDYMFSECLSLTSLNLSNFHTPMLTSISGMFYKCGSLKFLDISNFNTEKVTEMKFVFYQCKNLLSLDISNFNTAQVATMLSMFSFCQSLTSLDLNNFDTSQVTDMKNMFYMNLDLRYLKINNFKTQSVRIMEGMFFECESLTSLNLSSFDTNIVSNMNYMFSGCKNLAKLDISNFAFTSLINMEEMFYLCKSIQYINFVNYNELNESVIINNILYKVPNNIVICINQANNNCDQLNVVLKNIPCHTIYCGDDWKSHQKKIIAENNTCIEDCQGFKYENDNKCYSSCPEGADFCQSESETITNADTSIRIKSDKNEENISTNLINVNTFDIIRTIHYEENIKTTLIVNEDDNRRNSDSSSFSTNSLKLWENNEKIYQEVIKDIMTQYNISEGQPLEVKGNDNFYYQITTSDNDKIFLDEISQNNNNNINKTNMFSKIELGDCEKILKNHYHINENVSLIIIKFEKVTNISSERALQYEVYEPFNKTKLDLSICNNETINIYVPVVLSQEIQNLYNELKEMGYDLFNESSAFYQDICTPYKSSNGTDVLLSDRYNYYFNNNETKCQSNCKFSDYLMESQHLKCECDISNSEIDTEQVTKFKPKMIYQSFYDTLKFSNYKVLKCLKLAFDVKSFTKNKGSIVVIVFFILYLIFFFLFLFKGKNQLRTDLSEKILKVNQEQNNDLLIFNGVDVKENNEKNSFSRNQIKSFQSNHNLNIEGNTFQKNSNNNNNNHPPKKKSLPKKRRSTKKKSKNKILKNVHANERQINNKILIADNKMNSVNPVSESNFHDKTKENCEIKEEEQKNKLDNFELNNLEYNMALKLDKREFLEIYWSILKREHLLFFTFFVRNDYNIVYIKFSRFIFLVCTNMAFNVFFFADETMHKMFLDYGKYNFLQQIPQIIYSTLVSQLIELFLCFLSMTDKHFYQIKNLDNSSRNKMFQIIKCVKIKIMVFYIFTFIMFLFYWYIITCFCAVYENTQMAFIKDSLSSFCFGLLYPFILYLFPAGLRRIVLRATTMKLSCLYAVSDIIPFF